MKNQLFFVVVLLFTQTFTSHVVLSAIQYLGHDISSLITLESSGTTYHGLDGKVAPLEQILKAGGMNAVRVRIWVNPANGVYNLDYAIKLAQRVKTAGGLALYVDLHYSDTWADPAHQTPPAAWPTDLAGLSKTIYSYTQNVVATFKNNGLTIDIISIGNEIRVGLLWPLGKVPNYDNIAQLLKQASAGVKAGGATPTPKIMIHLDNGWSWSEQESFYDGLLKSGVFTLNDFDIQGVSFYPFYGTLATLNNLNSSFAQMVNKYKKDVIVAETDWPVSCSGGPALSENIPVSVAGQIQWVQDIAKVVKGVAGGKGKGIFYWEPAWFSNANLGSGCKDAVLFDGNFSSSSHPIGTARNSVNMYKNI